MDKLAAILKRFDDAKTDRDYMAATWREVADYMRPVKQGITHETVAADFRETPNIPRIAALFDTTAVDANMTYAAGCMSWMTPSETHWFAFDAPPFLAGDDEVKRWYGKATEETRRILALSNFYSQIHEVYLDDGAFGTSGLMVDEDGGLRFEALNIGEFCVLENERREVDTVFRSFRLSARQAIQKFGESAVHEKVRECYSNGAKDADRKDEYLHVVMRRDEADRAFGKIDAPNMPWAVLYIDRRNKHIVQEGGAWEMPVAVHRHLLWSHTAYGFSPGMLTLPDARQLNYMQQFLDTLVEKQVSPPVLLPADYEGSVDLRAGGQTFFKDEAGIPRFWPNPGNYLVGEDRVEFRKRQIMRAFHVELFQALSAVPPGKEMTAEEVRSRHRDRLTLFSPTFARKNAELNTPVMRRIFGILLRGGAFPPVPDRLVQIADSGIPFVPDPEIIYTSRLALQIKAIHNETFSQTMGYVSPLFQLAPGVVDHFDVDAIVRGIARNEGFREDWLRPEREVEEIRQARAEAQQREQARLEAMENAGTAAELANAGIAAA